MNTVVRLNDDDLGMIKEYRDFLLDRFKDDPVGLDLVRHNSLHDLLSLMLLYCVSFMDGENPIPYCVKSPDHVEIDFSE